MPEDWTERYKSLPKRQGRQIGLLSELGAIGFLFALGGFAYLEPSPATKAEAPMATVFSVPGLPEQQQIIGPFPSFKACEADRADWIKSRYSPSPCRVAVRHPQ
jgi:hypothetical protein